MRIDDGRKNEDLAAYLKRSSKAKATSKEGGQSSIKTVKSSGGLNISDNVELSDQVKDLQHAHRLLGVTPEMRGEKVGEIKEQVASGSYDVEDEEIADSIIKVSLTDQVT